MNKLKLGERTELLKRNKKFWFLSLIIIAVVLFAIIVPFFTKGSLREMGKVYQSPSNDHPLGTDKYGLDMLARMAMGLQNSLKVSIFAALISLSLAMSLGGLGAYIGGLVDESINMILNIIIGLPTLPLLIVLSALLRSRSLLLMAVILGITNWAGIGRGIRSQVLSLSERNFVDLATISGKGNISILFMEIYPNMLAYIMVEFVGAFVTGLTAIVGLSTIGIGPDVVSLGKFFNMTITDQLITRGMWWVFVPPGVILTLFAVSMIGLASVIDEVLNPRLRGRQ